MKKLFFMIAVLAGVCLTACSEQDIESFGTKRFVYFQKFWKDAPAPGTEKADKTDVTFFFAEDDDTHVFADLQVVLAGRPLEQDLHFKLRVVEDMTTALPDEYTLDDFYTFKAKPLAADATQIDDVIQIKINRSERLETMDEGYKLTLEIVPTEEALVGQYERSRAVLYITKDSVQPLWWTREVEESLLGTYSPKKYKLFLKNVEGAGTLDETLIKEHPDRARKLVLDYKKWLAKQAPDDIWDEDLNDYISVKV